MMAARSGGKILSVNNAGRSGENAAQIVARFYTDGPPYKPDIYLIQLGTNDSRGFSVFSPPLTAFLDMARVASPNAYILVASPLPATVALDPNNTVGTAVAALVAARNDPHIVYLPAFEFISDPVTGGWVPGNDSDGAVHIHAEANIRLADYLLSLIPSLIPNLLEAAKPFVPNRYGNQTTVTGLLFANGTFDVGAPVAGVAAGWTLTGAGWTGTIETDPSVYGNVQVLTAAPGTAVGCTFYQAINKPAFADAKRFLGRRAFAYFKIKITKPTGGTPVLTLPPPHPFTSGNTNGPAQWTHKMTMDVFHSWYQD